MNGPLEKLQHPEKKKEIKRHRLTDTEKNTVKTLYEMYGENCWDKVQEVLKLKSKRTAREHYYKFIATDSKKPFTPEEDSLIIHKVMELGTKWTLISKFFENRSDINIRNRYRVLLRKGITQQKSPPETYCMRTSIPQSTPSVENESANLVRIPILTFEHRSIINIKDLSDSRKT